jgi:hypothetical protein
VKECCPLCTDCKHFVREWFSLHFSIILLRAGHVVIPIDSSRHFDPHIGTRWTYVKDHLYKTEFKYEPVLCDWMVCAAGSHTRTCTLFGRPECGSNPPPSSTTSRPTRIQASGALRKLFRTGGGGWDFCRFCNVFVTLWAWLAIV